MFVLFLFFVLFQIASQYLQKVTSVSVTGRNSSGYSFLQVLRLYIRFKNKKNKLTLTQVLLLKVPTGNRSPYQQVKIVSSHHSNMDSRGRPGTAALHYSDSFY